ncbi:tRNA guanosine-2'-O-methyltransferase [Melioribacter roseus P3M-2]|uniref:tRNA (guanosine(18)-2'-O)-methyltransferase n=1 Tax=Melioribacter roseus (strain DSM 23840 / JCM 17771 / VKM B-2668 / P3M-2) TaxID=1191523 RepID=I6ZSX6_MELRP|nr:TrmH family RNA methyltransferase [Melioribacter roseus]AFN75144.1 tRNA guanosine-2'-O-methyltransferase [Melioribacter roseus P3M-2]
MRKFRTESRIKKISETIRNRQFSLRVVIENVHDPHNVSAVFRTCDAVGVPKVSLIYTVEEFPKISKVTSASANKWIETEKFNSIQEGIDSLHKEGFKVYASYLDKNAINLYDLDLTGKVALVFGNEHRGISEEMKEQADGLFYIPMYGMIQSLNISVAAAVTLYEAQRQRKVKGMYDKSELTEEEINKLIDDWCEK